MFTSQSIVLFFTAGILGLFGELIYTAIKRVIRESNKKLEGSTSLWMFPVYGSIAYLFPPVQKHVLSQPWFIRGIVYMLVIFIVEYMAGVFYKKILGESLWHYSGRFSLHGHIQLVHAPLWFAVGILLERYFYLAKKLSGGLAHAF